MAERRVKTITIRGVEFCEGNIPTEVAGISWFQLALILPITVGFLLALSLIGIDRTLHGSGFSKLWVIGFMVALFVLGYGLPIASGIMRRNELRDKFRLSASSVPEDAAWVKIGATTGWLFVRNGLLIFESPEFCFELTKACFVRPDRILKDVASKTPIKLQKADGLPEIRLKLFPLYDFRENSTGNRLNRFRQVIKIWQEQGDTHDKPLYPPILLAVPEESVSEACWKAVVRTLALWLPTGIIYALSVSRVPPSIWPNHSSIWLQGAMISSVLLMFVGPIVVGEVYDNWFRHKRNDHVQKCIEAYGSKAGERVVSLTD